MTKDKFEAVKCLYRGNYYYDNLRFCEALLQYNQALCYAEHESLMAAICYGKRSIVYFDLKEYDLCLANIEMALTHNPDAGWINLVSFKEQCDSLMKTHRVQPDEDPMNFFKLSYPSNKRLPCLVDGLQLKVNEKYGRHLVATRAFRVGDIIGLSDFSFAFFDKRARLHHCNNCTKSSMKLSLIPCRGCSKAMYCSEECMTMDAKKFHQFECGIEDNPEDKHFHFNPLKIFMEILAEFDGNFDEMKMFLETNTEPKNVFDFDLSNKNDSMYKKNLILSALSIRHNLKCGKEGKVYCLQTHHRFIMKHETLKTLWLSPNKDFLDQLLLTFLDIEDAKGRSNCFSEIDLNLKEPGYDITDQTTCTPRTIGTFFPNIVAHINDPYMSLLNQSCYPNLITKFVNGRHAWIVVRPVKPGEQLFIFLGPGSRYMTPRDVRQRLMRRYFGFDCDCDGCQANWPLQHEMKRFGEVLTDEDELAMYIINIHLQSRFIAGESPLYNEYKERSMKMQVMSKYYPLLEIVYFESMWMFNIYRLSLPAKWFSRPKSTTYLKTNCR